MSDFYGGINLIGGPLSGAIFENLETDPDFSLADTGRVYFNKVSNTLKLNNGTLYLDITIPANFNNLVSTLGTNWVNQDYTFNPTDFNELTNVEGLTSNSTLFNVIQQLDSAIVNINDLNLTNLADVVTTSELEDGQVMYFNGTEFTFFSIDDIVSNFGNLKLASLKDFNTSNLVDGSSLFYNEQSSEYVAYTPFQTIQDLQSTIIHNINHTLNVRYCNVTLVNPLDNSLITTAQVIFTDVNSITITLTVAGPVIALVSSSPLAN
jgi:hypothetical protein